MYNEQRSCYIKSCMYMLFILVRLFHRLKLFAAWPSVYLGKIL